MITIDPLFWLVLTVLVVVIVTVRIVQCRTKKQQARCYKSISVGTAYFRLTCQVMVHSKNYLRIPKTGETVTAGYKRGK